ncbi:hypothetical protein G7075_00660 [Phycicoccus sp. HDW14]|uniref:hypothetical protein n=1 Tax=Phycicoccus sp. HDW14 TaxID=2714941 RepID=UPI001408F6EF|nr:hypothetical protein [Phycicoccus sp. HDW14]QIM19992.1 hypothetical protein G7075_00660 [Phycicoccus sp. HDW14]
MNRSTLLTRSAVAAVAAVLPVTLVASPASAATQAIGCSTTYGGVSKYRQATVTDGVVLGPTTFSSNVTNNGSSRYLFSSSLDVQVWTKNG